MKSINIVIKPTMDCNLRCKYCYHANSEYKVGTMSENCLETIIKKAQTEFNVVKYIWHGGEPLLCGISFFEKVLNFQRKYIKQNQKIKNSIQTNGTLLTKEIITFLHKNNFKIGVSFDGINNDKYRQRGKDVEDSLKLLKEIQGNASVLCVLHSGNIKELIKQYEFFKQNKYRTKFNPIFKLGAVEENPDLLLEDKDYILNFKKFFDYWVLDSNGVNINPIDQYLNMVFNKRGLECTYSGCLGRWLGIDSLGNTYPCGRLYEKKYRLGNIFYKKKLSDVFKSRTFIKFLTGSIKRIQSCSVNCDIFHICKGGCNNNFLVQGDVSLNGGSFCYITKELYNYVKNFVDVNLKNKDNLEKYNPVLKSFVNSYNEQ